MKFIQFWQLVNTSRKLHRVEISDDEHQTLLLARERLVQILDMEILYDQIVEAYVETKSAMYDMSLRNISDNRIGDRIKGHNIRSKLNRLYFNVLNLSKLYLDNHFHDQKQISFVKNMTGDDSLHSEVALYRQGVYDTNLDYRLGCGLRNYVQHNSLPVTTYTAGVKGHPDNQSKSSVFHIPLDKEKLARTGMISKSLLSQYGETLDLHSVMDGYMKGISEMHMLNRKLIKDSSLESKRLIDNKAQKIADEYHEVRFGIEVLCDSENPQECFDLTTSWFDLAEYLQNKNHRALDFKKFSHHPYRD